ncbi:hypothetical protein ACFODT_01715 [Vibrio zhugei]|uniref:Bacterial EndoU nuclease domain-containing protein n=1 Tax=Vibrio zhugei TaxID=2479546 RepID=A0ABV7C6Y3_9VIBR|nr:hypothetical protein [Vibrio zhugei]
MFLTHKDHYQTLRRAILEKKKNKSRNEIPVQFDRQIGLSIKNQGTHANRGPFTESQTNKAVVRFDPNSGKFFTAYPE